MIGFNGLSQPSIFILYQEAENLFSVYNFCAVVE